MSKTQLSNFWSSYLEGIEELPSLPIRSAWIDPNFDYSVKGTGVVNEMKNHINIDIDHYCEKNGVTVQALIHGVWAVLLSRYCGIEKILFESKEDSNSKPIVILVDENKKVKNFLLEIDANLSNINSQETVNYNNLYTIKGRTSELTTLEIINEYIPEDVGAEKFEYSSNLVVSVNNSRKKSLSIKVLSNKQKYYLDNIVKHLTILILEFIKKPTLEIKKIKMMTNEELNKIIVNFNKNITQYPAQSTIINLFEEQVRKRPENVAIEFNGEYITYEMLNNKSNYVATRIINLGVNKGSCIGIITDRSPDLIVSIIATLKVGCIYVPIDSEYPPDRVDYILEDSSPEVCIINSQYSSLVYKFDGPIIFVDEIKDKCDDYLNYKKELVSSDPAYINYTSGSTGQPKGVVITHKAVLRLVMKNNFVDLSDKDCFLQISSPTFDAATFEIWGALLNGGRLVMLTKNTILDLRLLTKAIELCEVNSMFLTSALFNQIVDLYPESLSNVDNLVVGGDKLSIPHVNKGLPYFKKNALVNGYGPTENTTFSCCYRVNEVPKTASSIPIGYPLSNSSIYILDKYSRPCPIGVIGEIYTGGDGVAKGYLNKPEKTQESFITNPFNAVEKIYKTGDLGRWLPDGIVEFFGRKDFQVKIRGYRIELAEIENVILSFQGINECVVLAMNVEGSKRLVAYYTTQGKISVNNLKEWNKSKLPKYMVPYLFIEIEEFPLNSHGKFDRKALEKRELSPPVIDHIEHDFRSETEVTLANIWKETLSLKVIGPYDNFFEIGGDSILLMKLQGLINQRLELTLSSVELLEYTNIRSLALFIEQGTNLNALESRVSRRIRMKTK
ncbi:amino acid adenylation domain-containing protein [Salipaludibacillus agaradhaerens]|uniref:amino acid adenylation domain-containing protein n=1 Tax=Salipaludibacillus agaradhaerens TaxID=76935 RepID=UPI002151877B|nr:amino acid adenylation domain-containing protein [Salipaludibacillus agaradhaerens]MCR6105812.1 amino acid adenylation domain-containing protein [Salipaludibacillus agaradhaerens]MCR6117848.1 amino acid adenylation domain-containing protein [Salipaludibacillus agaradhaerens]